MFAAALLVVALLQGALAAAEDSTHPQSNPSAKGPSTQQHPAPHSDSSAAAVDTQPAPEAEAESSKVHPCNPLHEQTKLAQARYEFNDLHLDKASDHYLDLLKSCDPDTRTQAAAGFNATHDRMSTWWWQEGRYFPPFRWYHVHYPRFWWALLCCGITILVVSPFFYLTDLKLFHGPMDHLAVVLRKLRKRLLLDQLPRAYIMTPSKLTEQSEAALFGGMLESSSEEVRRVLLRAGSGLQVRATALLALPSETTSQMVACLPSVKGVDVAGIARFFFFLKRYLGWRVESQIGYCPATKSSDGVETPARVVASATLRHAFWVRGGPWPVKRTVLHAYDIDGIAYALAARLMGVNRGDNRAQ
jgi:hypothetical protein